MDINWDDVQLFLAVAETGSLSGAARQLRIGQPTVSRRLAALEYRMGAKLFDRRVDGASLTSAGERLVLPATRMAEWAGEVGRVAESPTQAPRGLVRVTGSPFVCHDFLAPFAAWLAQKEPGLRLEVLSTMEYLDLGRGEADLALRLRPPVDGDLVLIHDAKYVNHVYVSRSLAARLPKRPRVEDIPWLAWAPSWDHLPPNPQLRAMIPNFRPQFTTDNFLVMLAAAEAGVGAMVMAIPHHRFIRPRQLVALKIDLGPHATSRLCLVSARSALEIPRVRRVAELLHAELKKS